MFGDNDLVCQGDNASFHIAKNMRTFLQERRNVSERSANSPDLMVEMEENGLSLIDTRLKPEKLI